MPPTKLESFWTDTVPAFEGRTEPLPARADAVVVGGGFTGLSAALDTAERMVREENIDCGFVRRGKLKLASRAPHYEQLPRSFERLQREADPDVELLPARAVRDEIGGERFAGGLLFKKSAQMHMGSFGRGLAEAAARRGALIDDHTPVQRLQRLRGSSYRIHTRRGTIDADQVLLATGATRVGAFSSFSFWRRRTTTSV